MRINKYLSECGYCSRREADRLIEEGAVEINGVRAVLGAAVNENDKVAVNGKPVDPPESHAYYIFNKPVGVVCTLSDKEGRSLKDYFPGERHITYAGRLDKESHGLLIMTDDGGLINALMTGRNGHEKEYIVTVSGDLDTEKIKAMENGLYLREINIKTRPCKAWISGKNDFHIILTQGINRQIRRMCKTVGLKVTDLKRIRIENIFLGGLESGKCRKMTDTEITELKKRAGSEYGGAG